MIAPSAVRVERWTPGSMIATAIGVALIVFLAVGPAFFNANVIDKLTLLFIYVILAAMWNALAGYGGLISVGQQAFFGLGAYAAVRLANLGLNPFLSLFVGAILVGAVSLPISTFMLRLKTSEFAIGMWVIAELAHLLVNLDGLINGETGTSFIELNRYDADLRHMLIYWSALAAMVGLLGIVFLLLRSRVRVSIQAAAAGALWVASAITFQPQTYFSVQWTAYMIFMVLVGGIGTFEGAIVGAVIFFLIEAWFGAAGVWYLVGLGATALLFSLFLPRGIWGSLENRFGVRLLPVGYRLKSIETTAKPPDN
jgi:branched-chain amino acid transport system permease protein